MERGRITVGLALTDAALRSRLVRLLGSETDLRLAEGAATPDIVVAEPGALAGDFAPAAVVMLGKTVSGALPANVRGLLPATADPRTILEVVRLVADGLVVLPEGALERLPPMEASDEEIERAVEPVALTPRERQVLELLAAGASNKLIARRLDVSVHTAKFHVASLLRKLGAAGRLDAVGIGLRAGLLMI